MESKNADEQHSFQECITKLKTLYLRDRAATDDDQMFSSPVDLGFFPLAYYKKKRDKHNQTLSREPISYEEIIREVNTESKCILIQSKIGNGKSTTIDKISRDLSRDDVQLAPNINLVIRVHLQRLASGLKLELRDLILAGISLEESDSLDTHSISSFVHQRGGKGILFLFDGFDELAEDLQKDSLVLDILRGKTFPKSSCIVTSHPSAIALLPQEADQRMELIKIKGFAADKMKLLIRKWFNRTADSNVGERLIEAMARLGDMSCNPLCVIFACRSVSEIQSRTVHHLERTADHPERTTDHPESIFNHPEGTTDHPERTADHPERTTDHPESISNHPEGTTDHPERTTDHPERTTDQPERTTNHPVRTTDHPERTTHHPERTTDHPERTTDHPERTTDHPERTTDHQERTTDHPVRTTDHPERTTDHPERTTDQPERTTDQPERTTDHPERTTDHPERTAVRPKRTTNNPVRTTDHPARTTDHPVRTADRPKRTTNNPVRTTDHPVRTTDHPMRTIDHQGRTFKLMKRSTSRPERTSKLTKRSTSHPERTLGFPERTTELLKSIMCQLANHFMKRCAEPHPHISQWEEVEKHCSLLGKLEELALHSTVAGREAITNKDASLLLKPTTMEGCMGFLTASTMKYVDGSVTCSYHFFYPIVQEFLAALCLSKMSDVDQTAFWEKYLLREPDDREERQKSKSLSVDGMVFQFYAGLTRLKVKGVQDLMCSRVDPKKCNLSHHSVLEQLCSAVFESQNAEFCTKLFSAFKCLKIESFRMDRHPAVYWCLSPLPFQELSINLSDNRLLQLFVRLVNSSRECLEKVEVLQSEKKEGTTNLTSVLEQISNCARVQVLHLSTMKTSSKPLVSIFKNSTALKELYMERVRFVNTGKKDVIVGEISQGVKLQRELSKVTMRVCSEELVQGVVAGLGEGPALEKLTIEGFSTEECSISLPSFVQVLSSCSSLNYTRLVFVQLVDKVETVVDDIADAVGKLKNLSNVKLLVCCDELVQGMMAGLRRNDCLTKLAIAGPSIEKCHISEEFFIQALSQCTTLQSLYLECVELEEKQWESVENIRSVIRRQQNLSSVALSICPDELVQGILEGLGDNTGLKKLIVEGPSAAKCHVTRGTFVKLFGSCTSLQNLVFQSIHLADTDTNNEDISKAAGRLQNLSQLRLYVCCDELVQGLVDGMSENKLLENLTIVGPSAKLCRISEISLLNTLRKCTNLTTLHLRYVGLNDMSPNVGSEISGAMCHLKHLTDVKVKYCSDDLTRAVTQKCPDKKELRTSEELEEVFQKTLEDVLKTTSSVTLKITRCMAGGLLGAGKTQLKGLLLGQEWMSRRRNVLEDPERVQHSVECGSTWTPFVADENIVAICGTHIKKAILEEVQLSGNEEIDSGDFTVDWLETLDQRLAAILEGGTIPDSGDVHILGEKQLLYFMDTDNQERYRHVHPALITSPSVYFVVFNLMKCLEDGGGAEFFREELIQRPLRSIHTIGNKQVRQSKFLKIHPYDPKIFIVGTHLDKVREAGREEEIESVSENVSAELKMKPYKKLVQPDPNDLAFWPINNTLAGKPLDEDSEDSEYICDFKSEAVEGVYDAEVTVPLSWLILEQTMKTIPEANLFPYRQLFNLCSERKLVHSENEFHTMLYIFHILGLFFFPPILKDAPLRDDEVVYTNPDYFFRMTSRFQKECCLWESPIAKETCFRPGIIGNCEELLMSVGVDERITQHFLELLRELRILSTVPKHDASLSILPSALWKQNIPERHGTKMFPAILLLSFTPSQMSKICYIPCGFFHLLVADLIPRIKGILHLGSISRNYVRFALKYGVLHLVKRPSFIEIHFDAAENLIQAVSLLPHACNSLRHQIKESVLFIWSEFYKQDPSDDHMVHWGFHCTLHESDHPPTHIAKFVGDKDDCIAVCVHPTGGLSQPVNPEQIVWFSMNY